MRQLIPNFFISTQPLGWQCSECSHAFPASGMVAITDPIPSAVTAEFNAHRCRKRPQADAPPVEVARKE